MTQPTVVPGQPGPEQEFLSATLPGSASRFEDQLRLGYYTGILETYGVRWDLEKVARDTLQNFFDPKLSLDSVKIQIEKEGLLLFRKYRLRIESDVEYGYQKLLHMGGTSKAGEEHTAGGFGEGTKILALVLLRDFGYSQVRFGSGNWQIDYYLADPPEGSYDAKVKGLYCKLTTVPYRSGNFIDFVCNSSKNIEVFNTAKDLFYHPSNPDFFDPSVVVQMPRGGEAGFKFLGGTWLGLREGHLYDAGQRRHYESAGRWHGVKGMHIWTIGTRVFHLDRDRGLVTREDLETKLIAPMVRAMSTDQLMQSITSMESIWPFHAANSWDAAYKLLEKCVAYAANKNVEIHFPAKYLYRDIYLSSSDSELLQHNGYVLCHDFFRLLGMPGALKRVNELKSKTRLDPSPEQQERINVLKDSVNLLKTLTEKRPEYSINLKDIWLFNPGEVNRNLLGQHSRDHTWMNSKQLASDYASALSTYLHELLHDHGGDNDKRFGYALTDTLRITIDVLTRESDKFKPLIQRWHRAKC